MIFPTLVGIWSSPKETDQKSASSVLTFFATHTSTLKEPRQITDLQSGLKRLINYFLHLSGLGSPAHTVLYFFAFGSHCLSNPLNFLHQYQTYYLCVISLQPWKSRITQREFEKVPAGMTQPPFSTKIILLKWPESFCTSASLCSPQDQKDLCHATQ